MADMHKRKYQYSISETKLRETHSEEQILSESQPTIDAPLLQPLDHDDRDVSNSGDGAHSGHEPFQGLALDCELSSTSLLEKQSEMPQDWPTAPQSVNLSIGTIIWNVLVDITLLALSFSFLAFALFVVAYDGKPTSSHRQAAGGFEQASTWSPTIYPILFASVVGRATHVILLWRLERGEKIGTLDVLAGSTSLKSTVASQFHLRLVSYVGVGLVTIWMLSPVGGQSSFRQISFGPRNLSEHAEIFHVVPSPYMLTPRVSKPTLNLMYQAAIISPTTRDGSPRDAWGHIKVPRVEYYESTSDAMEDGWYKTENGTMESYSSFVGIPIGGVDSAEFIDYSTIIQAAYFTSTCDACSEGLEFAFNHPGWLGNIFWNKSTAERAELDADNLQPFVFVIHPGGRYFTNCTVETAYVEVQVTCPTPTSCSASRIRRSRLAHPPTADTPLQLLTGFQDTPYEKFFPPELADLAKYNDPDISNGTENIAVAFLSQVYLKHPKILLSINALRSGNPSSQTFATSLGQLLSAYWGIMNGKGAILGSFNEFTYISNDTMSWSYRDESQGMDEETFMNAWQFAKTRPSKGTKRSNVAVFQAHYGWVIALIVSSSVLITASLIPFYVRTFLSRGPDIRMNFSSLATRREIHMALPATGTYLDAADRLRYLKDLRIQFGDVEEGSEIGRLAIGRVDGEVALLRKGRRYV